MLILLDTSFLLPTFEIDAGAAVSTALAKIANKNYELHYSQLSLLEAGWVFAKRARLSNISAEVIADDPAALERGVRSITESGRYREVAEPPEAYSGALRMLSLGHRDFIDCMLYLDSVHYGLRLLTLDTGLRRFLAGHGLEDTLIFPSEL